MLSVRLLIRSVSHNLFESSWTLDYYFFFVRCPTGAYTTGCCCWWWWWSLPNIQPNVSFSITANYSFRWAQLFTMSQPYIPLSQIFWSWTTRKQRERQKNTDKTLHTLRSMQFSFASPACSAVQVKNLWNAMARAFFFHLSHLWLWNGF